MSEFITLAQIDDITQAIRAKTSFRPTVGMILGSGLGPLAEAVQSAVAIPYQELPPWPVSTVPGHQGRLVIGRLEGQDVLVMQGRSHYYEGYSMSQVGLPVRVMQRLGVQTLIVTNAAGAINRGFAPGDLMLLTDHLNLIGMAGLSPLRGPNLDELGPRFPDMSQAYDRGLLEAARQVGKEKGITLHQGVYACLAGPSFETPTDLRFLRLAGVDAVGMSTVPEVTVARHGGLRVLGISGISNQTWTAAPSPHEEVLAAGQMLVPKLTALIQGVLHHL